MNLSLKGEFFSLSDMNSCRVQEKKFSGGSVSHLMLIIQATEVSRVFTFHTCWSHINTLEEWSCALFHNFWDNIEHLLPRISHWSCAIWERFMSSRIQWEFQKTFQLLLRHGQTEWRLYFSHKDSFHASDVTLKRSFVKERSELLSQRLSHWQWKRRLTDIYAEKSLALDPFLQVG